MYTHSRPSIQQAKSSPPTRNGSPYYIYIYIHIHIYIRIPADIYVYKTVTIPFGLDRRQARDRPAMALFAPRCPRHLHRGTNPLRNRAIYKYICIHTHIYIYVYKQPPALHALDSIGAKLPNLPAVGLRVKGALCA